jgi:hypothetical protein
VSAPDGIGSGAAKSLGRLEKERYFVYFNTVRNKGKTIVGD